MIYLESDNRYNRFSQFGLVWFYGTSTIEGYLKPNQFLNIYIEYICFGLVGFHGISIIVGYLCQIRFININSFTSNNSV